ncbi:uncharacterized protein LOC109789891 isoform X2 [Cajanus cajan]|uniref:uncharacterized protein LOC109789891 isoform X2 n=1 Tax=Cajanus cajan TaxID=3821 RepID=UPI0010FB13DC|nr:uncharacterized protein LOC109789891 isoform X2 [Cajanus cajan]
MSTTDKREKDIFNLEGEVKSSAELLRRFQIKREKVLGNTKQSKGVMTKVQGTNIKKNKPPTTAAVTSKPKGFDNQIRGRNQGTFSIANHSTSDQGEGKNVSEKKFQKETANVQGKKTQIKHPMKLSIEVANMQSKKTQIQVPKKLPIEATNIQGKKTQVQVPKKFPIEVTNKRKLVEYAGSHGRQPIERAMAECNERQENEPIRKSVAEHSGSHGRQSVKMVLAENNDSRENLQNPQKKTRKVSMCPAMLIDQFLQENVEFGPEEEEQDASENEELMEKNGHEEENALQDESSTCKKKTRGPTRCLKIHARSFEERQEVTLDDDGEPIGPKDKVVSDLSYFLGTVARNPNFCPLIYTNFKGLTMDEREQIWDFVNEKFIIPEKGKKAIFARINDAWRRYKNYIKRNYFLKYSTLTERLKHRPKHIPENQYKHLMVYWRNSIVQNISQKNAINRAKQKYIHRMGPTNFARIRAKLQEKKNGEDVSQAEMFIETRQSRKGKETKLQESIQSSSSESAEQAFQSIFGKEKPGRVRCLGRTITPSMLKKNEEIVALKKQHSVEIGSMAKTVQRLQCLVRCLLKEINPELNDQALDNIMENGISNDNSVAPPSSASTHSPGHGKERLDDEDQPYDDEETE